MHINITMIMDERQIRKNHRAWKKSILMSEKKYGNTKTCPRLSFS